MYNVLLVVFSFAIYVIHSYSTRSCNNLNVENTNQEITKKIVFC